MKEAVRLEIIEDLSLEAEEAALLEVYASDEDIGELEQAIAFVNNEDDDIFDTLLDSILDKCKEAALEKLEKKGRQRASSNPKKKSGSSSKKNQKAIVKQVTGTSYGFSAKKAGDWIGAIISHLSGGLEKIEGWERAFNVGKGLLIKVGDRFYIWKEAEGEGNWQFIDEPSVARLLSLESRIVPVVEWQTYKKNGEEEKRKVEFYGYSISPKHIKEVLDNDILMTPSSVILSETSKATQPQNIMDGKKLAGQGFSDGNLLVDTHGRFHLSKGDRTLLYPHTVGIPCPPEKPLKLSDFIDDSSFLFGKAMIRWFPDSKVRQRAWEIIGAVLYGDLKQRKIVICYGDGGTGKTTFATCIGLLAGERATATLEATNFQDRKYITAEVDGMKYVHINDVPVASMAAHQEESLAGICATLKGWTGARKSRGRRVRGRFKDIETEFNVVITCNEIEPVGGAEGNRSMSRRLLALPMNEAIISEQEGETYAEDMILDSGDMSKIAYFALSAFSIMKKRSGNEAEKYAATEETVEAETQLAKNPFSIILEYIVRVEDVSLEEGDWDVLPTICLPLLLEVAIGVDPNDMDTSHYKINQTQQGQLIRVVSDHFKAAKIQHKKGNSKIAAFEGLRIDKEYMDIISAFNRKYQYGYK